MRNLWDLLGSLVFTRTTTPAQDHMTFSTLPHVPVDLQGEYLLRAFLTPSGETLSRKGIESLLYSIKKGDEILGRALHIGYEYFLTALHVIKLSGLELTPQLVNGTGSQYHGPFDTADYDANTDLVLLKAPLGERVGKPLIKLYDKIPQVQDHVSQFVRIDGKASATDFKFQYVEPGTTKRLRKLILPANSLFVEKQGEVIYNRKNPPTHRSRFIDYCFGASIPCINGDSGSAVFLNVAEDKYAFVGIVTRMSGVRRQVTAPNPPFGDENSFYTGTLVIDRVPIERLISQYLAKSNQTPHPPSQ